MRLERLAATAVDKVNGTVVPKSKKTLDDCGFT